MKPIKVQGLRLKKLVDIFGVELTGERVEIQVGVVLQFKNARYYVTERRFDEKKGNVHITLSRDKTGRKFRKALF